MASSTAHITAAQRKILEEIVRKGRVIGYGSSWRTLGALRRRGLVTMDARGDYAITDAGRAALEG